MRWLCIALHLQASAGWEEYIDYVFPDDEKGMGSMKLLENAAKWKANRLLAAAQQGAEGSSGIGDATGGQCCCACRGCTRPLLYPVLLFPVSGSGAGASLKRKAEGEPEEEEDLPRPVADADAVDIDDV
jgi:hypothetical protein